jgi:hypothetical protein
VLEYHTRLTSQASIPLFHVHVPFFLKIFDPLPGGPRPGNEIGRPAASLQEGQPSRSPLDPPQDSTRPAQDLPRHPRPPKISARPPRLAQDLHKTFAKTLRDPILSVWNLQKQVWFLFKTDKSGFQMFEVYAAKTSLDLRDISPITPQDSIKTPKTCPRPHKIQPISPCRTHPPHKIRSRLH